MKKSQIALGVAIGIGVMGAADAAPVGVTLTDIGAGSNGGVSSAFSLSGTLFGIYNTSSGIVTMAAGTTTAQFNISPATILFTHNHTNWSTGAGAYTASAYSCVDGIFSTTISASLCGNYNFGANFANETGINYNTIPGTRTLGGDDVGRWTGVHGVEEGLVMRCLPPHPRVHDHPLGPGNEHVARAASRRTVDEAVES